MTTTKKCIELSLCYQAITDEVCKQSAYDISQLQHTEADRSTWSDKYAITPDENGQVESLIVAAKQLIDDRLAGYLITSHHHECHLPRHLYLSLHVGTRWKLSKTEAEKLFLDMVVHHILTQWYDLLNQPLCQRYVMKRELAFAQLRNAIQRSFLPLSR